MLCEFIIIEYAYVILNMIQRVFNFNKFQRLIAIIRRRAFHHESDNRMIDNFNLFINLIQIYISNRNIEW